VFYLVKFISPIIIYREKFNLLVGKCLNYTHTYTRARARVCVTLVEFKIIRIKKNKKEIKIGILRIFSKSH